MMFPDLSLMKDFLMEMLAENGETSILKLSPEFCILFHTFLKASSTAILTSLNYQFQILSGHKKISCFLLYVLGSIKPVPTSTYIHSGRNHFSDLQEVLRSDQEPLFLFTLSLRHI